MNWKTKALVQNVVARLPSRLSYKAYYWLQRRYGALRSVHPVSTLQAAVEIRESLERLGRTIKGKCCLEVGTGRRLNLPLVLWLFGADKTLTIDLNRYLKTELIAEDLAYIRSHDAEVRDLLDCDSFHHERFQQLLDFDVHAAGVEGLFKLCSFEYLAPGDASAVPLANNSIDLHVSVNVFEHISPAGLAAISKEAARVVKDDGLLVHRVDHSDHFSHTDKSLSPINFLRYGSLAWSILAGNRYMYMNRLQVDDFDHLFRESYGEVVSIVRNVDDDLLSDLNAGWIPLHAEFRDKPLSDLACTSSLFVVKPARSSTALRNAA